MLRELQSADLRIIFSSDLVTPGFNDVQFKVSVRPTGRTRLTLFGLAGRETLRTFERLQLNGPEIVADEYRGGNRLGVLNLSWTPGNRIITTTSLSAYAHDERDYDGFFSIRLLYPFCPQT